MPLIPGMMVMPTVAANTVFSLLKDRSYAVHSPDSLAVVSPMYNEELGAGRALASLLEQEVMPQQLIISINGATDATYDVVTDVLKKKGFTFQGTRAWKKFSALHETWASSGFAIDVHIVVYYRKVSKSESVNNLITEGVVTADRVLVVDGDTVFHPAFIRHLRENFYRLKICKTAQGQEFVLEDYGLQSGSVTSFAPDDASLVQRFISAGRTAEYAFSSVLRSGQAKQFAKGPLFGNSRLYTAVGCGFAVRRDLFPMPMDTETEDHDFSLACQSAEKTEGIVTRDDLMRRGFRFIVDGKVHTPQDLFQARDRIVMRRGGNARFVLNALMGTEDPPHFNGFIRQIERWNGGGQQNALKRIGRPLTVNVHFTVWAALLESVLGIFLLALLPIMLALNVGNPSLGLPVVALGAWLGLDLLMTFMLVMLGLFWFHRAEGYTRSQALGRSMWRSMACTLPFMVLRWINPLTYVASATRVVPEFLFGKGDAEPGVTWERAYVKRQTRTQKVFTWGVLSCAIGTFAVANLAPYLNPINQDAWRLVYSGPYVDMRHYDDWPFLVADKLSETLSSSVISAAEHPQELFDIPPPTLSAFCDPSQTRLNREDRQLAHLGDSNQSFAENRWRARTLARLAPLLGFIEASATAYDVPIDLLLMTLINESDLDPLAVGPTDDLGLSQVTSDALTLLKGLATNPSSQFYNPRLFPSYFNVFDPDFSVCAGAAKLAWALDQTAADKYAEAYALYINPIHGLVNGRLSDQHAPLVAAMLDNGPMVQGLADVFAAYARHPERLPLVERQLVQIAYEVRAMRLSVKDAYQQVYQLVQEHDLRDAELYENVLAMYFNISAELPQSRQ